MSLPQYSIKNLSSSRTIIEEWDQFIAQLDRCNDVQDVITLLSTRMASLGFEKSAYWLRWPNEPAKPHIILSTYPEIFLQRYAQKDYGAHDMVGFYAARSLRPFRWSEIAQHYKITQHQKIIFHDSSSVGVKAGGSVPIHGPNMTKATFSVAADLKTREFDELFQYHRHEIHILATSAHERLLELGLGTKRHCPDLTYRERDVLLWIARGLTYPEIADKLNISIDTVRKHTQNIYKRLGASNGPHAASIAIINGIIIP